MSVNLDNLYSERKECEKLVAILTNAKGPIEAAKLSIMPACKIGLYYQIDDIRADKGEFDEIKDKISAFASKISGSLSTVKARISTIDKLVEEEEKRIKEEEEKKKQEEALQLEALAKKKKEETKTTGKS